MEPRAAPEKNQNDFTNEAQPFPNSEKKKMDTKFLKDKKFWLASFLVVWAGALQAHMTWLQKQDSFKEKFGDLNQKKDG